MLIVVLLIDWFHSCYKSIIPRRNGALSVGSKRASCSMLATGGTIALYSRVVTVRDDVLGSFHTRQFTQATRSKQFQRRNHM